MLGSIAFIILAGLCGSLLFKKIKLPGLIGMLLAGIIIGPGFLNILDDSILNISAYIRKIALIIILSRAGLGLDLDSLKKNGRPAFLLSFVPAAFELIVITIIGPVLFNISYIEAAILGTVLAAVSPAVIVPRMLKLKEEGYRDIPEMILAGASVDDIFVIVLFTSFTAMAKGDAVSILTYVNIPFSIVTGILIGIFSAFVLKGVYKYIKLDGVSKTLVMFGISLMLVSIEDKLNTVLTFSSLISIMVMGMALKRIDEGSAKQLGTVYNKLWIPGEIFLFVLVGAIADLSYIESIGLTALMLIVIGLVGRMMGTALCLVKTKFNPGERLFCMLSYLPKATVQASIGPLALAMGFLSWPFFPCFWSIPTPWWLQGLPVY